jgi:gamma-glutamyltranspeptidase
MKNKFTKHRPLVAGNDWMIVSGSPFASQAGADILKAGGNAVDAAIAASAVLGVVRPHMNGPGGDLFALVYMKDTGRVEALNASGRSPAGATIKVFKEKGYDTIPVKGVLSATVPGVVLGWHDMSSKYGTLTFETLFKRAIELGRIGFPVYPELTNMIGMEAEYLKKSASAKAVFFKNGKPVQPGDRLKQKDLANSLELIAKKGADVFYKGELGKALVDFSDTKGGFFTMDDLNNHTSSWSDPITTDYRGYELCTQPPSTQGIAWLMTTNIIKAYDLQKLGHNTADYIHLIVETQKLVFADRDRYVCDPDFHDIPVAELLSLEYAEKQLDRIDMKKAADRVTPCEFQSNGEDTVYLAVVDKNGNSVSMIQSLYEGFGSCAMIDGTGIFLHNRGRDFRMDSNHVNSLEPKKRPYHTLTPGMILKDGKPVYVLGSPGADGQTQTMTQVTANLVDFYADAQEAVEAPRWRSNPDSSLTMEARFSSHVIEDLKARGHRIDLRDDWDDICGGAQVIKIHRENQFLTSGADPRRQAYAIGY